MTRALEDRIRELKDALRAARLYMYGERVHAAELLGWTSADETRTTYMEFTLAAIDRAPPPEGTGVLACPETGTACDCDDPTRGTCERVCKHPPHAVATFDQCELCGKVNPFVAVVPPEPTAPESAGQQGARTHDLKTWPEPFAAILDGRKAFEIRRDDRDFKVGDVLRLREWEPGHNRDEYGYTGRVVERVVSYLVPGGAWGLPSMLCVMGWAASPPPVAAPITEPSPFCPREGCNGIVELRSNDSNVITIARCRVCSAPVPGWVGGPLVGATVPPAPAATAPAATGEKKNDKGA